MYVRTPEGQALEYYIKSHPMYPTYNYPLNLNCYASFRTIFSHGKQELKFEVVEGKMSEDAFIAFGNDYGDTETYLAFNIFLS